MSEPNRYSHPSEPIRHSYPVALKDASVMTAFRLLLKTAPYVVVRFCLLVAVTIVTIAWFGITIGGAGLLGKKIHPWSGWGWLIAGCGIYGWLWAMVVRYGLYLVKCGHIAVLTELITAGSVNNGAEGMFSYGRRVVTERFGEVNVLFALDVLVDGVVSAFNRSLEWISALLPIPGLHQLTRLVAAIIRAATTYLDETILSYNLARGEDNPWRGGRDGIIYYCQNNREVLKTAVWCVALDYLLTGLAWGVMLAPAALLTWVMPFLGGWAFLVAGLFALNVREAVIKPLFLIMVMTKFHVAFRGQPIDEAWDERLTQLTPKFTKIKEKLVGYLPGKFSAV